MKLLKVRPRYEIGEMVTIEHSGVDCSDRWYKVSEIQVNFRKDGTHTVTYVVEGPSGPFHCAEARLANYDEVIEALGVAQAMLTVPVPKFNQWLPRYNVQLRAAISAFQKLIKDYTDAHDKG